MVASGSQHLLLDVASLEGVEWLLFLAIRAAVLSSQQLLFFQQCMAKTGIPGTPCLTVGNPQTSDKSS